MDNGAKIHFMRNSIYLAFLLLFILGCKKDKDQTPQIIKTDWNAELKNSVWSGEMQATEGIILIPQYCSITFGSDNKMQVNEIRLIRLGTWSVVDSTVTLEFGGTTIKAGLGKEKWKNFEGSAANQFNLFSAARASTVDPVAIVGSVYKGSLRGKNLQLEFLAGNNVRITHPDANGGAPVTATYSIMGSGVLFTASPYTGTVFGLSLFGCLFKNGAEIMGTTYAGGALPIITSWKATKQ
jgi:hypothetical protein